MADRRRASSDRRVTENRRYSDGGRAADIRTQTGGRQSSGRTQSGGRQSGGRTRSGGRQSGGRTQSGGRQSGGRTQSGGRQSGSRTKSGSRQGGRRPGSDRKRKIQLQYRILSWALTAVFVVVFYAAICACVGNRGMYKRTYINGIDVGGKKTSEAAELVGAKLKGEYSSQTITVIFNDNSYVLDVGSALDFDVENEVSDIQNESHSFWTRGYRLLESKMTDREYTVYPSISDKAALAAVISSSGLSDETFADDSGYTIENGMLILTKGSGCYSADLDKLMSLIEKQVRNDDYKTSIECPVLSTDVNVEDVYEQVHTEPQNPTLDADNDYSVIPAQDGVDFDVDEAKAALASADKGDRVEIQLEYTKANMTTEEYEALLFRDEVSTYSTTVEGSDNRKTNVRLAAESCDDVILLPGETFSYNEAVGQTTEDKGYMPAPAYANGESVLEYGGGICQVSSTLYLACLYANLQINERHSHPYPASYAPVGLDATVAYGSCDYVFTNSTEYPLKISMVYDGYSVVCRLLGTVTDSFKVELYTETKSTEPYETKYELDETMGEDGKELKTTGITGITVQSYRRVYGSDGNVVSDNAEALSVYSKRDEVYRVGRLPDDDKDSDDKDSEDKDSKDKNKKKNKKNKNEDGSEDAGEDGGQDDTEEDDGGSGEDSSEDSAVDAGEAAVDSGADDAGENAD